MIVLYGVPVLGFCMMSNTVIRAEGKSKNAMYAMLLPSISNLLLDYVFIKVLDFGMYGAAWATTLSYGVCACYILYFFSSKKSELNLVLSDFKLDVKIVKEMDHIKPDDLKRWLKYVNWTEKKFDTVCDSFRNPRVWWVEKDKWFKYDIDGKKRNYGKVQF